MKRLIFSIFLALALAVSTPAQSILPYFTLQFFDNNGNVLSLGTITTYAAGTSTPLATYSNYAISVANPTTITLNAAGRPEVSGTEVQMFMGAANYRIVIKDAVGATVLDRDNVTQYNIVPAPTVTATTGRYTPTLTGVANVAAITGGTNYFMYMKVNDHVWVSGQLSIDPTAAAPTGTSFRISLPIASVFVDILDAHGVGSSTGIDPTQSNFGCYSDAATAQLLCTFYANDVDNQTYQVVFHYRIL